MKITFISDTHGKHKILTSKGYNNILGEGHILVHAGDCTNVGKTHEIKEFLDWFSNTPFTHKVFIAGNHDWGFEIHHDIAPEYKEKGVHYLFDNMVELDGVKIYGSPWQPEFYDWAFNLPRGEKLAEKWAKIPEGLDILVTHGPAYGMVDHTIQGLNVGCQDLLNRILDVKPKIHVCGHIHQSRGCKEFNGTLFVNASVCNERYEPTNKPIVIEFDCETKKWEMISF
jgi:Icc-related predicted phosphoesterase